MCVVRVVSVHQAGSEAALTTMDSVNSVDLINFGGADSEASSIASGSMTGQSAAAVAAPADKTVVRKGRV